MNMILKTGAIAAALVGVIAMSATPSDARNRGYGAAAAGFVAGAAVGSIAASSYNRGYYGPDYGYGYYEPGYAYNSGPAYYSGPGYSYGYDDYAYAPRRQSLPQYRDGTGSVGGTGALSDR
jgi:hypothetical protein